MSAYTNSTTSDEMRRDISWKDEDDLDCSSVVSETQHPSESAVDEEALVRTQSRKETARVATLRVVVFLALLATAVSVTVTTYTLLVKQEDANFRNVYAQFARTVSDAAIDQQRDLRTALESISDTVSLSAAFLGNGEPTWPNFWPPMFETYAQDFQKMSRAEYVGISIMVPKEKKESYLNYSATVYEQAIKDSHIIRYGHFDFLNQNTSLYSGKIARKCPKGTCKGFEEDIDRDLYIVRINASPPPRKYSAPVNWNLHSNPGSTEPMDAALALRNETTFSKVKPFGGVPMDEHRKYHSTEDGPKNPHFFAYHPVHKFAGDSDSEIVALMSAATAFDASMQNLLPENVKGMLCVVENSCNQTESYIIDGKNAFYQGPEDLHDQKYDDLMLHVDLSLHTNADTPTTPGNCMYTMKIYPTQAFEDDYKTSTPAIFAIIVAGTFFLVACTFLAYDFMVLKRNEMMISTAAKSNTLVNSFVPDHLKERLVAQQEEQLAKRKSSGFGLTRSNSLKAFLNDTPSKEGMDDSSKPVISAPLADLFLETTVLFADISGFTAWSSVREPTQVFVLLETLYQAFDRIAKRRRVFKVETVGDCYVAVCGLPEARADHAPAMAKFARDLLSKMHVLTRELVTTLGPDTGDLTLRMGMHSGPVTAGLLRGERARFQLFGDTMNACARLESTSEPNRIQCSKETAALLIDAGKGSWVQKRSDCVDLKGLGSVEGYWVTALGDRAGSIASAFNSSSSNNILGHNSVFPKLDDRTLRLVTWNTEMLTRLLKEVVARRSHTHRSARASDRGPEPEFGGMPLEEVQEIITLPKFDVRASTVQAFSDQVEIPDEIVKQLNHLVSSIACMYNDNPFHNFDHASHVVMSVIKLMSRIVAPSHLENMFDTSCHMASLHDHTYGITSDPLTQFACAFSALIHDVDHVGVSNAQLVKEGVPIASKYGGRSVAEQNSLDLSWELLMRPDYKELRALLFPTKKELIRFRQLVVNAVMSTDIVDKELKNLRNGRWDKAFKKGESVNFQDKNKKDEVDRKATIVIEHIIQASDISHTMQHWHVYRKWNQCLFEELYVAYLNGRMEKNPADFWADGEIGFFDFYIIPLTKKLKECGVFGVSSDEYLNYAMKNREEWKARGKDVVANMVQEVRRKYGTKEDGVLQPPERLLDEALPAQLEPVPEFNEVDC